MSGVEHGAGRGGGVGGADSGVPNNLDYHLCMSLDYYMSGMLAIDRNFDKLPNRVVISDDIPWCKEHIPAEFYGDGHDYFKEFDPRYGTESPRDWIDLFTLAACDYFVVTGSTFGIWGAILSGCPPENVVRPSKVYGPLNSFIDESLLFPAGWRIVDVD